MNKEVMEHISETIKKKLDITLKSKLGITYDEFELLDFDEQQRLIEKNSQEMKKNNKKNNKKKYVIVMIGSGEEAIFIRKKRGERHLMLSDCTYIKAGDTPEEYRARTEDRLDDAIYSIPVAFIKKLIRKVKNR